MVARRSRPATLLLPALLVPLVLLLPSSCAFRQHMDQGDEHFRAGRYEEALLEYEAAQREDPEAAEAQQRVRETRGRLLGAWVAGTDEALARQDHLAAIKLAGKLHDKMPTDLATQQVVERVKTACATAVDARWGTRDFAGALAILEALVAQLPPVKAWAAFRVTQVKDAWADTLDGAVNEAEKAGQRGRALLLCSKAAQLAQNQQRQSRRASLRTSLLQALTFRVVPELPAPTPAAQGLLAMLTGWEAAALDVTAPGAKPPQVHARLSFTLGQPAFDERVETRTEQARYQSGTRQVPNPFFKSRQDEVTRQERTVLSCQEEVDRQQRYVEQYTADVAREGPTPNVTTGAEQNLYNAQNRLEAARRALEDERRQLQRANEELRTIPQLTEEPVYAMLSYTVMRHQRTGKLPFKGAIRSTEPKVAQTLEEMFSVEALDDEHPAQPTAGVPADPLHLPGRAELEQELYRKAGDRLHRAVKISFDGYREELLQRALGQADPALQVDGLVGYVLTNPAAVQVDAADKLKRISGIADAVSLIAAP